MDTHKNRENNLFGFQLSQIVTEYKKIPPYIEINKCVINKLNYYIDEKNND
jgi:hypothetical protein